MVERPISAWWASARAGTPTKEADAYPSQEAGCCLYGHQEGREAMVRAGQGVRVLGGGPPYWPYSGGRKEASPEDPGLTYIVVMPFPGVVSDSEGRRGSG